MKPKMTGKIIIDMMMTALLLLLMARQLTGDSAHEWLGAGMFVLWILHHVLNFRWHGHLFRGRYTPMRALQTAVNVLLSAAMAGPIPAGPAKLLLRAGGGAVAVYGLYAFIKNQFLSYMFLTSSFVFFDFERPLPLFFTEYIAIMGLFVFLAHYGAKGLRRLTGKK